MSDEGNSAMHRSGLKLTGEKRSSGDAEDKQESSRKRLKMRELESALRPQGIANLGDSEVQAPCYQFGFGENKSKITNVRISLGADASQAERSRTISPVEVTHAPKTLDLNREVVVDNSGNNGVPESAENTMLSLFKKRHKEVDDKCLASENIGLDLNVEDDSSVNQFPSYNQNSRDKQKSRAVSECGSTTRAVQAKDPLRVWKEMKQNGFMSTSHGGFSIQNGFLAPSHGGIPIPKQRGRKPKSDVLKKKMELAKKEQVDRFTKIAAPSGLLNGLNPGIINHVRNKKQVHSIIEALVRSEKLENGGTVEGKHASLLKSGNKEANHISDLGRERLSLHHESESSTAICGRKQAVNDPISSVGKDSGMIDKIYERNSSSHYAPHAEDERLTLKLSSSVNASGGSSNFSNEESSNISGVSYLSVRTATVASQWLELLHQDIKGRLSALRRSKKRVKSVVSTDLPFLISKEFSSNDESNTFAMKSSHEVVSSNPIAAAHQAKWFALYDQMDKALSEEERLLESSLNQVKELQLHCDHGLQHFNWNAGLQQPGILENVIRSEKQDSSINELAISAAAASIYSTCSFLMSQENVSCF